MITPTKARGQVPGDHRALVVEVGPRDGLQNEPGSIALADKVALIEALADAGVSVIECGSFVAARWVPQMADSAALFHRLRRAPGVRYTALTPNLRGYRDAAAAGASEVAVFVSVTETFSQRNTNCSVAESFQRLAAIIAAARHDGIPVRGYLSCVLGCPYEGDVSPQQVLAPAERLLDAGCYEVSLGDTTGVGTAGSTQRLLDHLLKALTPTQLAVHFHDTYGQALTNIYVSLQYGIRTIDTAVAGLGGCPYAPGASGNVATEDVVYLLNGLGIETGIDLSRVARAGARICKVLGRTNGSRVGTVLTAES